MTKDNIAMQERCIHCLKEQYSPGVYSVSCGLIPCAWCGKLSNMMTEAEYQEIIKLKRVNKMKEKIKKDVQKEILALLNDTIENEVEAMKANYTVAEIAKEILLNYEN